MLIEPLLTQLQTLGLRDMSRALEHQQRNPEVAALPFEDRLTLLLQHEHAERQSTRLVQRLRWARLPQTACIEDIDARTPRGLERGRLTHPAHGLGVGRPAPQCVAERPDRRR